MCNLSESVYYYPNRIISMLSTWHSGNKIHTNFFPLPLRYLHWLQQLCRSLVLNFHSLIGVAQSYILCHISFQPVPPISLLDPNTYWYFQGVLNRQSHAPHTEHYLISPLTFHRTTDSYYFLFQPRLYL